MLATIARDLLQVVEEAAGRLRAMPDAHAALRPAPEKWSRKEILGHLIDSASNNHQRFVRAQDSAEVALPAYAQDAWVRGQGYNDSDWQELVEFWRLYNRRLAWILERMPEATAASICRIGENAPLTLGQVAESYLTHLEHHLGQLLGD